MAHFELSASDIQIDPTFSHKAVRLSFSADVDEVAGLLSAKQIVASLDVDELLEEIGQERAAAYFGLVESDQ